MPCRCVLELLDVGGPGSWYQIPELGHPTARPCTRQKRQNRLHNYECKMRLSAQVERTCAGFRGKALYACWHDTFRALSLPCVGKMRASIYIKPLLSTSCIENSRATRASGVIRSRTLHSPCHAVWQPRWGVTSRKPVPRTHGDLAAVLDFGQRDAATQEAPSRTLRYSRTGCESHFISDYRRT